MVHSSCVHGARIFRRTSQQSRLYKLSLIQRRLRVALGGSGAFDGLEPCEVGLCLAHFLAQLIAFEPQVLSERLQVAGGAQHRAPPPTVYPPTRAYTV